MRNYYFFGCCFQLGLEAVISHVLIVPFLETPPQEPFQEGYLLAYGAITHIFLVTQEVHIVIQTVLGERIKGKFIPELFQVVLYRSEFFVGASVQLFCFPHSLINSSNASQKLILGPSAVSCSVTGASFILALKLSFICAGVGSTFCTSNSLKMFCISVYCLSRSALISDALCFSLFVHPFFTLCLSVSHLVASMRYLVVNSIRWLANITRIRIGTFSVIGTPFFLPAFQCENDVSFDIHNWVCLKIDTQKYTQEVRYAKILRDILFSVYFVITW